MKKIDLGKMDVNLHSEPQKAPDPFITDDHEQSLIEDLDHQRHRRFRVGWRRDVKEAFERGDTDAMLERTQPYLQLKVIETALESDNPDLAMRAAQFALGQAGRGTITRVDNRVSYEQMSNDQLISVIASQFADIKKLSPGFDVSKILQLAQGDYEETTDANYVPMNPSAMDDMVNMATPPEDPPKEERRTKDGRRIDDEGWEF